MSVPQAKTQTMRLVLTLAITCVVAGALLAAVYGWMNPMIEARKLERVKSVGLQGIFPEADSFEEVALELPAGVQAPVYRVFDKSGKELGLWFQGKNKGYGGDITMAIGVDTKSASVVAVRVMEQNETAGLGSRITEDTFLAQFNGKPLSDRFALGADVSGITGATVSSRAVSDGVARMAREVLAAVGVEVQVTQAPEPAAEPAAAASEPAFAGAVRGMLGDDVVFEPAGMWEIRDGDALVGVAMVTRKRGYAADIEVLTVVDPATGTVKGIQVLKQSETPGIGTQVTQPTFTAQFAGKSAGDPFKVGEDIDGATFATVSSQAVADAVKQAAETIVRLYSGS